MSNVLKYSDFLNEKRKTENDYAVGDIVMIRYYLTGDLCPVEIIAKKTKHYFIVSHKVKDSFLYNAPDHGVKESEIIGRYKGVGDPINSTERAAENPRIQPDVSGMVPGWNSYNSDGSGIQPGRSSMSNDISF
jgi:hypothetical protein